jgi:hypothetical protein
MKLSEKYKKLEAKVNTKLIEMINQSKNKSKFLVDQQVLKIRIWGYIELAYVNNVVVLINESGCHTSIHHDNTLEEIIDIIENINDHLDIKFID